MNLQLEWIDYFGYGPHIEAGVRKTALDMSKLQGVDDLIELTCRDARVPLSQVKQYPHGHLFEDVKVQIEPADPECSAMLELGDEMMMRELAAVFAEGSRDRQASKDGGFRLISRRINAHMNSLGHAFNNQKQGALANLAFLHPNDLARLQLVQGETVCIRSIHGSVLASVKADDTLRVGVISMPQGVEMPDSLTQSYDDSGSATRLVGLDECDAITGIPRMSGVPVIVEKVQSPGSPLNRHH
jgi:anaerobic selenocysteine-containing dehydrogenase